jgi:hypothetical protein
MKKIIKTLYVAAAIALFVFAANEKTQAQYRESCSREMAEETAKYVRDSKISLKDAAGEFYSDQDEQIYLLSSQEKVSLNVRKPPKRVVAVIASKVKNENTVFYVVESEFKTDSIIYSLKRNGETVQTSVVKIIGPPWIPPPGSCKKINTQVQIQMAQMQQQANAACRPLRMCFPMCKNGIIIGYMMVAFYPHNPLCPVEIDLHNSLERVFNRALDKDPALFTHTDEK